MRTRRSGTYATPARLRPHHVTLGVVVLLLTFGPDARAGVLAGGSSEFTQVLNKIELITQTKKLVDQVQQAKQTFALLRENFERLSPASWAALGGALDGLADAVVGGERLAFSLARADEDYARRFSDVYGTAERPARFSHRYQRWWGDNRAMVQRILKAVGLKVSDFHDQRAGLRRLQSLSRSPGSRDQILQAANELAVAQWRQLQELQAIGMQQIALQGHAFTAEQEQVHDAREATRRALQAPRLYRGNEKKY